MSKKKHTFKAEIQQVLDLVIHSLYSKKEIFLRELISNASDAIDRAQYSGLTDKSIISDAPEWKIDIFADKEEGTLMISDNGMGMSEEDLDKNLGVIASSGTKAFAEALKEKKEVNIPELIGQFGVGFYSAFMVAEEVTVITLKRGEGQKAVKWNSVGDGSYTLDEAARDVSGTTIILKLREEQKEYFDSWRIRELVKKYSDFIAYPIRFKEEVEPVKEGDDSPEVNDEPLNAMTALWKRSKSEVKDEEYNEFYTHLTHDHQEPLEVIHAAVEGVIEFRALLFLPKQAGFDLMMPNQKHGLNLYVRNVLIGADFEMLLPEYLRFVKGVVDSSDLPLNISREMLQDDAVVRKIKSNITGKVLNSLAEMMRDEPKKYKEFYIAFGRIVKEGLHSDWENADKLKNLVMFPSAKTEEGYLTSLQQYVDAMPQGQDAIYYLPSEDISTARQSPHLEALTARGYDVLFFVDPVDQWIVQSLTEFDGKKLIPVDKGDLKLGDEKEQEETKKKLEGESAEYKSLIDYIQGQLKDDIKEVRLSPRLTDSACCLVADENAMNASMERMMRAMNQEVPKQLRLFEINPGHTLIKKMKSMFDENLADERLVDYVELLYGQALLGEGSAVKNPQRFTKLISELMVK
ncbi:MAG: molecular chaperone HtpG [Kiritimatiellae bacterium]|jgi:molecular chaperone HtpG|nr:molecular chaperone HtpG [Kiritimatiellia bacterium]